MDMITWAANGLIAVTLIYCIILERRIRKFRQQESVFKSLIAELSRSTMAAQSAASDLRRALNEAQSHPNPISASTSLKASRPQNTALERSKSESPRLPVTMTAADLARHFADLRLSGAQ